MTINIEKFTKSSNKELYYKALKIREEVFIKEQNVSKVEELENEEESVFYLLFFDNEPASVARYRLIDDKIKLERFATLKKFRRKGLATKLLKHILKDLKKYNNKQIYLHSQVYIVSLYEKEGFVCQGDIFYEAGIPHYKMILKH